MYITPFSPRAADFYISSLILPPLGGREDPPVHRWKREKRKESKGGGRRKELPGLTHLITRVRCSLAGDLERKRKNTTAAPPSPRALST